MFHTPSQYIQNSNTVVAVWKLGQFHAFSVPLIYRTGNGFYCVPKFNEKGLFENFNTL